MARTQRKDSPPKDGGRSAPDARDTVALVDDLLQQAARAGASDIHFEPTAQGLIVKFRLDGTLSTIDILPGVLSENVVSRLKVMAGLLTYRNDVPQEGRLAMPGSPERRVLDSRVSVFPTIHGQRAVVRLFYEEPGLAELEHLGLPPHVEEAVRLLADANQGLLLLTGPAGSGKSTTLAAVLRHIVRRSPGKSIVALEDPVERRIEGVTQVQVSWAGQMDFTTALRSLLRQDPQVLMLGEIRDAETARIAVEAALTGHLLMSTMHSGSPAGALLRLLEMGVEPYQVTSSVSAVLNQRLLRKLCEHCRRPDENAGVFRAAGCERCLQTGYRGRTLIAEIVQLDAQLRRALLAKADLDELQRILTTGGHQGLRHDAARLVRLGVTSQEEVQRVCGPAS